MTRIILTVAVTLALAGAARARDHGRLEPVPYSKVNIRDNYWSQKLETNRENTIPHVYEKCEETGRISNFARAAGLQEGGYQGLYFNDSDVYKFMEGMAHALGNAPDEDIQSRLDGIIKLVAAAQCEDGYLNGWYQLEAPDKRWTNLAAKHELYCAGHLFEAAVAHHRATGREELLNVAVDLADLIDTEFGPDARHGVAGHEEIELALVKLWEETGHEEYLELARFFVEQRGNSRTRESLYGTYAQDHKPIRQQEEPVGHCVRAMYLYSAVADLAAVSGDEGYVDALRRLWNSVVNEKMYVTGGVGVHGHGEGFAEAYYLPNTQAYTETCASIGMAFWNHRMFLLTGEAQFADIFERVLYNGLMSGVSLDGREFFYTNPLMSQGNHHRSPWFGCACCPSNVVRFVPAVGQYMYALRPEQDEVYVVHYAGSSATVPVAGREVKLTQKTRYPWDGRVRLTVRPESPARFAVCLRIPDWARGTLDSTDLYHFADSKESSVTLKVNGERVAVEPLQDGFARISRRWEEGDIVELNMSMPVRRVHASDKVKADRGKVALMRGPVVYCLEGCDNEADVPNVALPPDAELEAQYEADLLGGVVTITGKGRAVGFAESRDGGVKQVSRPVAIKAVPYYAWDNREAGPMTVWMPEEAPEPSAEEATLAVLGEVSYSHCHGPDAPSALNDCILPENSNDHGIPRFTWWAHRGSKEWVAYEFEKHRELSHAEVYWFDDTGRGQCRVPASWRLLGKDGGEWKPVEAASDYPAGKDRFCEVDFKPVRTKAIRLEVQLKPNFSGGILEWRVSN